MNNFYAISDLKASNRKRVYDRMAESGIVSRVELGNELGISPATILKIVDYFIENKICFWEEVGDSCTSVGRKPVPLRFNADFAHVIAVFVEGRYISVAVVNMLGEICAIREFRTFNVWDFLRDSLFDVIKDLLGEDGNFNPVVIGMALPAVINLQTGNIVEAPLIGKADENTLSKLKEELEKQFELSVCIQNDVNVSAFGEYRNHYAMQTDNMIYISVGTGVGCGIILNGKLLLGENNFAGEIGYMIFEEDTDYSKKEGGWLEKKINLQAVDRMMNREEEAEVSKERTMEFIAQKLSLCITNITALLDINLVVLDGIVVEGFQQKLIDRVQEKCDRLCNQKLNIQMCKSYKPGIAGLSHIAAAPVIEKLMNE